jgi:TonB family protein
MARFVLLIGMIMGSATLFANNLAVTQSRDSIYEVVDRVPKFKGTPSNPEKFFERQMIYPEEALLDGLQGVVNVSFIVTSDGHAREASIAKSVDPLLDSEALRLVELMQEWRPALKDGTPVHCRVVMPVSFRLSEEVLVPLRILEKYGLQDKKVLYIIDDKIAEKYIEVPGYNVKSIRVMKGQKAIDRYGPRASDGVIIITTKRGTPPVW